MSGERRWELHVCRGCGSYAGKHDLEPRFGNIVGHKGMTKGCTEPAEVIEVVPASRVEALEEALREIAEYEGAVSATARLCAQIAHAALAPPEGEADG